MSQSSSHFSSNPSLNIARMSVSSPLTSMPSFDKNGIDPTQESLNRLQQIIGILDSTLRLPNTPRAFAVYLVGLVIVFAGAFMHVLVAAQIMQAEFTLSQLQDEYLAIEQQNGDIIFKIARDTNMERLHQRVIELGYVPAEKREYIIVAPNSEHLASTFTPETSTLQATVVEAPALETAAVKSDAQASADVNATVGGNVNATVGTNASGGQWARWEEFWSTTLRSATGSPSAAPNPVSSQSSPVSPAPTNPNFWAVWWEQASTQGSKLLEQFSGQ